MFEFTKTEYEKICEECMLNEEYKKLFEMKIKGYSRAKMSMELNISESTLDTMIQKLKKKLRKLSKNYKRTQGTEFFFLWDNLIRERRTSKWKNY